MPVFPARRTCTRGHEAVRRLRSDEIVDNSFDLQFDVGVAPVRQRVARRLDPLADVGVPEHLHREAVRVPRISQRQRATGNYSKSRIRRRRSARNRTLSTTSRRSRQNAPVTLTSAKDAAEYERPFISNSHLECRRPAPHKSRTISEHGRRRTPAMTRPAIMSSRHAPASRPDASRLVSTLARTAAAPLCHDFPVVRSPPRPRPPARRGPFHASRRSRHASIAAAEKRVRSGAPPREQVLGGLASPSLRPVPRSIVARPGRRPQPPPAPRV